MNILFYHIKTLTWLCMPLTSALGKQTQADPCEFQASLASLTIRVSSRHAGLHRETCLKNSSSNNNKTAKFVNT